MPSTFTRLVANSLGVLGVILAVAACRQVPTHRGDSVEVQPVHLDVHAVHPVELAVPPVEDRTTTQNVPTAELRKAFQTGLVRLRYTPLALDYVDGQVMEAGYHPGSLGEDAVLSVLVNTWDDSRLHAAGTLTLDAEVYLLDPARPDPASAIWGGRLTRSISLAADDLAPSRHHREQAIVRKVVEEILGALPARDPETVLE